MEFHLEVDSVVKSFDDKPLFSDVSLSCKSGDIVGLFGRNGSGKSTLLEIIFGSIKAQNMFMRLNGRVIKTSTFRKEISFLPQFRYLPNSITLAKAMSLFLPSEAFEVILNDALLKDRTNNKIAEFSYGEIRYIQAKLLLYNQSQFCLLDEPFSGLSPVLSEELINDIMRVSKNKGIIITDHTYDKVLDISTKNYLLKDRALYLLKGKGELVERGYLKSHHL